MIYQYIGLAITRFTWCVCGLCLIKMVNGGTRATAEMVENIDSNSKILHWTFSSTFRCGIVDLGSPVFISGRIWWFLLFALNWSHKNNEKNQQTFLLLLLNWDTSPTVKDPEIFTPHLYHIKWAHSTTHDFSLLLCHSRWELLFG